MTNTIAIIAAGTMGSAIARRMAENGARVLTSLNGRSQATVDRAHRLG
jgi:3-hydroxyacyl-CoA dehydrogenase